MSAEFPEIEPTLIRDHVRLIHFLSQPLTGQGKVVATGFGEDPNQNDPKTGKPGLRLAPHAVHAAVGDVQESLRGIAQFLMRPHYNLYMPLAIHRPDLRPGAKGLEQDIVGCLGIVADFDDPESARWAERLPLPPNYVLETSAGRFQAFYLFDRPERLEIVKPVAERLKAFAGCDHGTSDISHVWRVPGALNWPNAKKVAEGRSPNPQLVRVVGYDRGTTSLQALSDALPKGVATSERKRSIATPQDTNSGSIASGEQEGPGRRVHSPHRAAVEGSQENLEAQQTLLSLPLELQEGIKRPAVGDRSKALFRVIAKLIRQGVDDDAIENVIYAHPRGIGEKYAGRDDLDKEIAASERR
jgi:hypothetical protein